MQVDGAGTCLASGPLAERGACRPLPAPADASILPPLSPPLPCPALQPVQLAVQELRYGLALLSGAASLAPAQPGARLAPVLARLMAFPRASAAAASWDASPAAGSQQQPATQLDSPEVQQAVADAAAAAAEARGTGAAASGGVDAAEAARRAAYQAAMAARLQLLRCSLDEAARDLRAARLGGGASASVAAAQGRLHAIFMGERPPLPWQRVAGWHGRAAAVAGRVEARRRGGLLVQSRPPLLALMHRPAQSLWGPGRR